RNVGRRRTQSILEQSTHARLTVCQRDDAGDLRWDANESKCLDARRHTYAYDVGDDREHIPLQWLPIARMIRAVMWETLSRRSVELLDRFDRGDEILHAHGLGIEGHDGPTDD